MKCALVPIDGSAAALRALQHALHELAQQAQARVHLLNVQARQIQPWPGKLVPPEMIDAELRKTGARVLAQAESMAQAAGIKFTAHVGIGAAAHVIDGYAREHGCDAIVMGTRGLNAVADLVLGSVAHKLVHLASVPVTLVK